MFEAERPALVPYADRFDGFHAVPASVSKTCLVRFDNNRCSVAARPRADTRLEEKLMDPAHRRFTLHGVAQSRPILPVRCMLKVYGCFVDQHDFRLVVLAASLCTLTTFGAMVLLHHARQSGGRMHRFWLCVTAVAIGFGIWATHFVAMLAFAPEVPSGYAVGPTFLSLAAAILITGGGLLTALVPRLPGAVWLGGAVLGMGIATMHFTGMAAYHVAGRIIWDPTLVVVSIALAPLIGAISLFAGLRNNSARSKWLGAVLLTLAICSHHFTAMGAVTIAPDPLITIAETALPTSWLAAGVALTSLAVLLLAFGGLAFEVRVEQGRALADANTQLKDRTRQLGEKASLLEVTLDNMDQGLVMVDADGTVAVCNRRAMQLLDLPLELMRSKPPFEAVRRYQFEQDEFVNDSPHHGVSSRGLRREQHIYERERPNGTVLEIRSVPLPKGGVVRTYTDITARKRAERQVQHIARHDILTNLPNRSLFGEHLAQRLADVQRYQRPLALLCIDLDQFKAVNDTLGHPAGDTLLQMVAARMRNALRAEDILARLGGDEFAILQAAVDQPESSGVLAHRLVGIISECFVIDGHEINVGASIGIALAPEDGLEPDELLKRADLALYRAKESGRNTVQFFKAAMDEAVQARQQLEFDLHRALAKDEFDLHYQPVLNVKRRKVESFEALLRWRHPTRGLVPAGEFIPVAERSTLIVKMGDWVLREACAQAATWPRDIRVAVNVSPMQFRRSGLVSSVESALDASGLSCERLEIEITESVLLDSSDTVVKTLNQLRGLGVRIALDDFGTGYSSLSYLRQFSFDRIKIDRSFVIHVAEQDTSAIVSAIVGIGKRLGAAITAEGVETQEQFERICDLGCTDVQGYFVGRPQPVLEIDSLREGEICRGKAAA
jgi:diguanylate cyclase (GGDEF)-like protein